MSYAHINSNVTAKVIQTGTTRLDRIVVGQAGSADWRVTIYDGVNANGTTLSINNLNAGGNYEYHVLLTDGLTVTTAGTTPGDITLVYG